ncbi:MAG: efflux RND transporter periplasmic adaptor subunit [Methylococcales bacterium]
MTTFKQKIILTTLLILLIPTSSFAEEKRERPPMPTPKADVFKVEEPQNLALILKYPAQIQSLKNVMVVSRAAGVLKKKYFNEGQAVNKGDLLYTIEDNIYLARVNVAQASVKMSQAVLDNASRSWKRIENLFKNKTVSEDRRDTAHSIYEQASAAFSLAKAQLKQAQIDLNYTKVTAPISGIIGLKKVDIGDFVSATPPTDLIEITQNNKIYVEFSMPLRDYANIKNKLWTIPEDGRIPVTLEIDNKLTQKTGRVDFMDVNINKATSTVKMRALVDNSDFYLMPGEFIRVVLNKIVQKDIITIPQKAVLQNPLGTIVFVVNHGHVAVKPVILGRETDTNYIVKGGPLRSGDQVIVNNFFRLKPGAEVIVDKQINSGEK